MAGTKHHLLQPCDLSGKLFNRKRRLLQTHDLICPAQQYLPGSCTQELISDEQVQQRCESQGMQSSTVPICDICMQ